jgi:hypothetical protein
VWYEKALHERILILFACGDANADLEVTSLFYLISPYSLLPLSWAVHIHEGVDAEFLEYKCLVKNLVLVQILTCKHPFIGYLSLVASCDYAILVLVAD